MLLDVAVLLIARAASPSEGSFYVIATIHGVLGALAEIFGLYIVLVAETKILPEAWRFKRWNRWMRVELALWWFVLMMGGLTYWVWHAG